MKEIISQGDEQKIRNAFLKEIITNPPRIGLVGVSGVGKSSTINSLFKTNLKISHIKACTKEFTTVNLTIPIKDTDKIPRQNVKLEIVDAPGLGEDIALDPQYIKMYKKNLKKCDIVLWVLNSRNRAIALDQNYLLKLQEFSPKIIFAINQVDLVYPNNWNSKLNLPSLEQEKNIELIIEDRKRNLEKILKKTVTIIAYSASHQYRLEELFASILEIAPKERAWIFSSIKAFSPFDFIPEDVRNKVITETNKNVLKKNNWFNKFFK